MDTPRVLPGHAAGASSEPRDPARSDMTDRRMVAAWRGDQQRVQRIEPLSRRFEFRSPAMLRDDTLRTARQQPAPHDPPRCNGGLRDAAGGLVLLSRCRQALRGCLYEFHLDLSPSLDVFSVHDKRDVVSDLIADLK